MNLHFEKVADKGVGDKERAILNVLNDTDLSGYALADTTYDADGNPSNEWRHLYWFPGYKVKKGDIVVLYTNVGEISTKANSGGTTTHFFHMGLGKTIWNKDGDGAILFQLGNWQLANVA